MESEEEAFARGGHGTALAASGSARAVIFYSPGDAYRVGALLPCEPGSSAAEVQDAENRQLYTVRLPQDIHHMTAPLPHPDESDDLLLLHDATEGPLLCTLRLRYQDERYCTAVGRDIMLMVHPPQPEGPPPAPEHLYLQDRPNLPPHPWMLAARALQHVSTGNDAVVVLSGDQGSGKTAVAKAVTGLLHTLLPPGAEGSCSTITVKLAKQVSGDAFCEAISRNLSVPAAAVHVLSAEPVQIQKEGGAVELTQVTFRFRDIGQDGERLAKDFRANSNIISQSVATELSIVASSVSEPKVWPSKAVTTLVDAFCNARTTRNVSSTRATVLTRYAVKDGHVIGAEVRHYLLELSRAQGPPQGERTFHVFYYLMAGASDWERDRYHLPLREEFEETAFAVLTNSDAPRNPWEQSMAALHSMGSCGDWTASLEDLCAGYDELVDAFDACRVSPRVQDWIFRVLAAILHLGQLSFVADAPGSNVTAVSQQTVDSLQHVAECLQLNVATLESALTCHIQSVMNERVDIRLTPQQAASARDALIRALYEKVVDVTFATLNAQLAPTEEVTGWLSLLDFMGTEDGAHNDLGALANNYANEVLQNFYNKVVFDDDVSDCVDELGSTCDVSVVDYPEVYSVVKLLRANLGVFSIIDEESSQSRPSDATLLESLTRRLSAHPKFERRPVSYNCFTVRHSCGDIEYNVSQMTTINRNAVLPQDVRRCLTASLCKYTAHAFLSPQELKERQALESEHEKGGAGVPPDFVAISARLQLLKHQPSRPTYLARVKHQVFSLMSLVEESKPFFVRCIKPAKGIATASGAVFHGRHVMRQLTALSVLSTLKQKQLTYAFRQTFDGLLQGLWMIAKDLPQDMDARQRVQELLNSHGISGSLYRLGKSKAFLAKDAYTLLRERQRAKEKALAEVVQSFSRASIAVHKLQVKQGHLERAKQEQQQLQQSVKEKREWERKRSEREADDRQRMQQEEARSRRNVDNQESVGYITIMTGLIEGVERVKQEWSSRKQEEERSKQRDLQNLLREERQKEERCASEMLSQRMLAQGGKLDRILAKKFSEEQRLREKRSRQESTQQRLLRNRLQEEQKRLQMEKKIIGKEEKHGSFRQQRSHERLLVEKRRIEQEENDKHAREARFRARQVWEEAKRDEYDLEQIERDVVRRVERELLDSKRREGFKEKLQSESELREGQERIARLEKLRASKQLQREKVEKESAKRTAEEKQKRELHQWKAQQQQRMLNEELDKIKDHQERKRFARRQKEKQALSVPRVYHQLVEPALSTATGSPYHGPPRSPASRSMTPGSVHRNPPSYQPLAPPSPFVTSTGAAINAPMLGSQKKDSIRAYHDSIHRRTASKSPSR